MNKFVLVKDSAGTFVFVPQGTAVPNGVNSKSGFDITQSADTLTRQVEAAMVQMGANRTQITTALGAILAQTNDPTFSIDIRGNQSLPPGLHALPTPGTSAPGLPNLNPFKALSQALQSALDFLRLIGWLFHPRNWLRAVEFLTGISLMIFGTWAAFQHRGERAEGFTTGESAISRSGLGRVARQLAANAPERSRRSESRPQRRRVQSAPHRTRRQALRLRYEREQNLRQRRTRG